MHRSMLVKLMSMRLLICSSIYWIRMWHLIKNNMPCCLQDKCLEPGAKDAFQRLFQAYTNLTAFAQ